MTCSFGRLLTVALCPYPDSSRCIGDVIAQCQRDEQGGHALHATLQLHFELEIRSGTARLVPIVIEGCAEDCIQILFTFVGLHFGIMTGGHLGHCCAARAFTPPFRSASCPLLAQTTSHPAPHLLILLNTSTTC